MNDDKRRVLQRGSVYCAIAALGMLLPGCGHPAEKEFARFLEKSGTDVALRHLDSPQATSESMRAALRTRWDNSLSERSKEHAQEKLKEAAFDTMTQPYVDAWKKCEDRPDLAGTRGCMATELYRPQ